MEEILKRFEIAVARLDIAIKKIEKIEGNLESCSEKDITILPRGDTEQIQGDFCYECNLYIGKKEKKCAISKKKKCPRLCVNCLIKCEMCYFYYCRGECYDFHDCKKENN